MICDQSRRRRSSALAGPRLPAGFLLPSNTVHIELLLWRRRRALESSYGLDRLGENRRNQWLGQLLLLWLHLVTPQS